MKKNMSYKILNILLILGIVITVAALFLVPSIVPSMLSDLFKSYSIDIGQGNLARFPLGLNIATTTSIGVYICAVPYVIALFLLKRLCTLLTMKNPFTKEVPKRFKEISICVFVEFLLVNIITALILFVYIFDKDLFFSTFMILGITSLLLLVIGLVSLTASNLFNMAIQLKDENDKTI